MALCHSFTIPGSCSNTISVRSSSFPSLAKSAVLLGETKSHLSLSWRSPSQSICDRLLMNISYTRGLRGSTLAWLRSLWQRKQPTEMNSDTRLFRLRKGKRRGKINRIRKAESYISSVFFSWNTAGSFCVPYSKKLDFGNSIQAANTLR
jgi:hypothetical protein